MPAISVSVTCSLEVSMLPQVALVLPQAALVLPQVALVLLQACWC